MRLTTNVVLSTVHLQAVAEVSTQETLCELKQFTAEMMNLDGGQVGRERRQRSLEGKVAAVKRSSLAYGRAIHLFKEIRTFIITQTDRVSAREALSATATFYSAICSFVHASLQ